MKQLCLGVWGAVDGESTSEWMLGESRRQVECRPALAGALADAVSEKVTAVLFCREKPWFGNPCWV